MTASTSPYRPGLSLLFWGGGLGAIVGLGLYGTKLTTVALLPIGLLVLLPTFFLKNFRLYWFALFLLSLQFEISKNLNDGMAVLASLKIDYLITHFTFNVTGSDLALLVLFFIWLNDNLSTPRPVRFPPVSWLAVGYLVCAGLSTLSAPSRYLALVDFTNQLKYFAVYLYAVNCLDSKPPLRLLAIIAVIMLITQASVTVYRFETGNLTFISLGDAHQDLAKVTEYLTIDRSDPNSAVRAFGTLSSPNGTTRLCLMLIPFALFFCVRNGIFAHRATAVVLAAFGSLGPVLTFTRVYFITTAVQFLVAFFLVTRGRMLKAETAALVALLGLAALGAVSPKLYKQFTIREDSVSVRALQNEAAVAIIRDHPLFGVGLNNAPEVMRRYSKLTYNQYDANTQFYLEPINNMLLNLAAEIGVIGALCFICFFSRIAYVTWKVRDSPDPVIRYIANCLFVVYVGVSVNILIDPFDESPVLMLFWMFAGVSLNLSRMYEAPVVDTLGDTDVAWSRL